METQTEKNRIKESYKTFCKEVEGYKSKGIKLPQGLNTKKPIPYTFTISKEKANKEHKIMWGLEILRLPLECSKDKKTIKRHIDILNNLFKEDKEILNIIQEVKEVLK